MAVDKDFLKKLVLLYVEDSKIQSLQTLEELSPLFKEIIVAVDGKDGFEKYQQHKDKIDVIISDIIMPNISGLEMIKLIRKIDAHIPCILTTSVMDPDAFIDAIDLHIAHYAIKPFNYDKLIYQLQKACVEIYHNKLLIQKDIMQNQFLDSINGVAVISKTDTDGKIIYINNMFCETSGYELQELMGHPHNIVRHPEVPPAVYKDLWDTITSGKRWSGIIKNKAKDGSTYYVKSYIMPIYDDKLQIKEYMRMGIPVTSEEESKRELKKGMIHNLNTQKMTIASLKKENELLKQELDAIKSDKLSFNGNSHFIKQKLENEQKKHKYTKSQLETTENRLKSLQEKYDKFLKKVAR